MDLARFLYQTRSPSHLWVLLWSLLWTILSAFVEPLISSWKRWFRVSWTSSVRMRRMSWDQAKGISEHDPFRLCSTETNHSWILSGACLDRVIMSVNCLLLAPG